MTFPSSQPPHPGHCTGLAADTWRAAWSNCGLPLDYCTHNYHGHCKNASTIVNLDFLRGHALLSSVNHFNSHSTLHTVWLSHTIYYPYDPRPCISTVGYLRWTLGWSNWIVQEGKAKEVFVNCFTCKSSLNPYFSTCGNHTIFAPGAEWRKKFLTKSLLLV